MKHGKIHIFTDCDLDGAMSYLVYTWFHGSAPVTICRVNDLLNTYKTWLNTHDPDEYSAIYFLDLDTSLNNELIKLIDRENVTIIDHHTSHVENINKYKKANQLVQEYTSACRLIYKIFTDTTDVKLTDAQKLLILLVDDYDSYKLEIPNSYELNTLFWNYTGDRLKKFISEFSTGFTGFNEQQQNAINFHKKKLHNIKTSLNVFETKLPIKSNNYKVVSTFATTCINDVADHIIKTYEADIGLVINTNSNKVSFRKSKECEVDLAKLSQTMCEEGGGHSFAAGGMLCDRFMEISKIFTPIK